MNYCHASGVYHFAKLRHGCGFYHHWGFDGLYTYRGDGLFACLLACFGDENGQSYLLKGLFWFFLHDE